MNNKFDVFEVITQKIIDLLNQGVVPWQIPWKTSSGMPRNLVSNRPYNGINFWLLLSYNYSSPFFLTFEQAKSAGGTIKKGEKSKMVVFWKILESTEKDGTITKTPFLRYYNVFNYTQTEGIDPAKLPENSDYDHDFNPNAVADSIIHNWIDCPKIEWDSNHAYYSPLEDKVAMPPQRTFFFDSLCYSTLYHELTHSTGHRSRTNRHEKIHDHKFGSQDYSQEELVAELGAAFLCGITGIEQETIQNNAAYIKSWIRTFQNDPKVLILAATQAQKAVDYILNHQSDPNHAMVKYIPYHAPEAA
jgi:antirestriction protein ArdC